MIANKKQYTFAMITIILTTIIWGCGFVMSDILIGANLSASFINAFRFGIASIIVAIVFNKHLVINKQMLTYSIIGGIMLFIAFMLQVEALNYTTASNNGFFTASYVIFVPFLVWIVKKHRPSTITFVGITVAILGFVILEFGGRGHVTSDSSGQMWIGNLMTIGCALFFGMQIVLADWALNTKAVDAISFTLMQLSVASVLFIAYFLIFDLASITTTSIDWNITIVPLLFLALFGTAFAYPAQINAQKSINPSTVSIILALEAVVGAIVSVILGREPLTWSLVVGGVLVTLAIIIVEFLQDYISKLINKRKASNINKQD